MKHIEKAIKIILSVVLAILFIPLFLYSDLVPEILVMSVPFFIYIYAIWSNLFENRKRKEKLLFYLMFLINNLFMFVIAFFTEVGVRDAIHEGDMQEGLISQITSAWMPYFNFFSTFCFFLIVLTFINNLIFNNRSLKWWNWLIVTVIPLICSIVCLIFWNKILSNVIYIPFMIIGGGRQFFYTMLLFFVIYLIYDKYKQSKLKKSQTQ